ncbi:MAG TPA: TetR family transcriptional regulator [Streptosporangiaceae bacterium]
MTADRQGAPGGRVALLQRAVDHFARHGVGDTSLRGLAEQIGTSHRMLIYHFGSREGLLAAVVDYVETAARATLAVQLAAADPAADPVEQGMRFWEAITEQALIYGPLFFELTSHAMQGRPHADLLRDRLVTPWVEAAAGAWVALGVPPKEARMRARLDLAVTRGLLHDLLLTGDRKAVDAAMRHYADTVAGRGAVTHQPQRQAARRQQGRGR